MKRVLSALLCFCCSSLLLAATLPALAPSLSQEQINLLEKGELLTTSSYEGDIWSLIPDGSRIATSIKDALENKKGFTLAISTLVPYPEGWKSLSGEERMLEMVNKAFETTTMDGMLFHPSPDSSKTKVLFRNSSLLSSPNKKDRTPNVHFDVLPNHVEYYIYQEDTNYGNDIYLGIFDVSPDELSLVLTNHNALTVATIPVVAAGKISLGMDMLQTDEGIYICGFASVKDKDPVFNVLGIKIDVAESVLVRVIALKDWYEARLAE